MDGLIKHSATINKLLARYGVKFGIYKNGEFKEQLFPFDPIPRVIEHEEFLYLEKGLKQRVNALNCFLRDIYGKKQIVKEGVIPEEFIFSAKGFLPPPVNLNEAVEVARKAPPGVYVVFNHKIIPGARAVKLRWPRMWAFSS